MFKLSVNGRRKRQTIGFLLGIVAVSATCGILAWPGNEHLVSLGPLNTGHEGLHCQDCHKKGKGTVLQQLNASAMHAFGMRKKPVTIGHEDVANKTCKACHDRPNDRHPVHRFMEPRFAEVRNEIHPERCESCHREHNEVRLVIEETGYCRNCHSETSLKNDPLDISHAVLIQDGRWSTCLQCHDFHGNHIMETPVSLKDTIPIQKIREYILGGTSPYSAEKKYLARKKQ